MQEFNAKLCENGRDDRIATTVRILYVVILYVVIGGGMSISFKKCFICQNKKIIERYACFLSSVEIINKQTRSIIED